LPDLGDAERLPARQFRLPAWATVCATTTREDASLKRLFFVQLACQILEKSDETSLTKRAKVCIH